MELEYGTATIKELPQMVELLGVLFTDEAEFQPDAGKQKRALEAILANPRSASCSWRAKAGASWRWRACSTRSARRGGKAAWFEDLVVHPEERKRGIGEALLKHVVAQARAEGCCVSRCSPTCKTSARRRCTGAWASSARR